MKRKVWIWILAAAVLLTGCQPSPETEYVVNRADGTLEEAIRVVTVTTSPNTENVSGTEPLPDAKGSESAEPVNDFSIPMTEYRWNESFSVNAVMDRVDLIVDAAVRYPADGAAPVASMRFAAPDERETQQMIAYFLGDGPYYVADKTPTKSYYRAKMDYCASQYEIETDDAVREQWQLMIEYFANLYASAPEETAPVPWDGSTKDGVNLMTPNGDGTYRYLRMDVTGVMYRISLDTTSYIRSNLHPAGNAAERDAVETALSLLQTFGVNAEAAGVVSTEQSVKAFGSVVLDGYVVYCDPVYCGLPRTNERTFHGFDDALEDTDVDSDTDYAANFPREEIAVFVADGTVQSLSWTYPSRSLTLENDSVALLPREEVQSRFRSDIGMVMRVAKGQPLTLRVHTVRLVLERVPKKDAVLEYDKPELAAFYLVPAWEFLASVETVSASLPSLSNVRILCINAVDGSIIS